MNITIPVGQSAGKTIVNMPPLASNLCPTTWGNCSAESPVHWGKPSETPHVCSGPRRHLYKLHICEKCGMLGAPIKPTPYSKAGAQLRAAILKHGLVK